MKKTFLALALTGLLFTSCKKETPTPVQPQPTQDCNCGEVINEVTVFPNTGITVRNFCTGLERSKNIGYSSQSLIGKTYCDPTGQMWQ